MNDWLGMPNFGGGLGFPSGITAPSAWYQPWTGFPSGNTAPGGGNGGQFPWGGSDFPSGITAPSSWYQPWTGFGQLSGAGGDLSGVVGMLNFVNQLRGGFGGVPQFTPRRPPLNIGRNNMFYPAGIGR
jgi:hypothetical protein